MAIVINNGTGFCKTGFADEDLVKVIPCVVGITKLRHSITGSVNDR